MFGGDSPFDPAHSVLATARMTGLIDFHSTGHMTGSIDFLSTGRSTRNVFTADQFCFMKGKSCLYRRNVEIVYKKRNVEIVYKTISTFLPYEFKLCL